MDKIKVRLKCLEMAERNTSMWPEPTMGIISTELIIKNAKKFEDYIIHGDISCLDALDLKKYEK